MKAAPEQASEFADPDFPDVFACTLLTAQCTGQLLFLLKDQRSLFIYL